MAIRTVRIDAFPDSVFRYLDYDAVVCVDVVLANTVIVTAVADGRQVFPVASVAEARTLKASVRDPLLMGEAVLGEPGAILDSPALLAGDMKGTRPVIVSSPPGTQLILNAAGAPAVYIASLRNWSATADAVAAGHRTVAILGAGVGDEFRCEDQMVAAWIARRMKQLGFRFEENNTADLTDRWGEADASLVGWGKSAEQLRRARRLEDLAFVLDHVDDLDLVCVFKNGQASPMGEQSTRVADGEGKWRVFGVSAQGGREAQVLRFPS